MAEASGQLPHQMRAARQAKAPRTGQEPFYSSPAAAANQDAASDVHANGSSVSCSTAQHTAAGPLVSSTSIVATPHGSQSDGEHIWRASTFADPSAPRPDPGPFTSASHQQQINPQMQRHLMDTLESSYSSQQGSSSLVQGTPQQSGRSHAQRAGMGQQGDEAAERPGGPLPLLASSCPGWVVYAEKTHGSYILPHISTAKSPQVMRLALHSSCMHHNPENAHKHSYH